MEAPQLAEAYALGARLLRRAVRGSLHRDRVNRRPRDATYVGSNSRHRCTEDWTRMAIPRRTLPEKHGHFYLSYIRLPVCARETAGSPNLCISDKRSVDC